MEDIIANRDATHFIVEKAQRAKLENYLDGTKNLLDCIIGANIAFDKKWNSGVIGAIGVATSIIWLSQFYGNLKSGRTIPERLEVPEEAMNEKFNRRI